MRRLWIAARKLADGLPLGGEAVWPGLRNDLYVAHESIYRFAAGLARGRRVLDAACGTGYGAGLLAAAGASSAVGIDLNPKRVRFAARRYRAPGLSFEVRDCENLSFPRASIDLLVSSNTLEHLARPDALLSRARGFLSENGLAVVAVPPLFSEADLIVHSRNAHHVSNLTVRGWADLFVQEGWRYRFFSHRCHKRLDFASFDPSEADFPDFQFVEEGLDAAYSSPPITALYVLRPPG